MEASATDNLHEFPELVDFTGHKKKKKVKFINDESDSFVAEMNRKNMEGLPSDNVISTTELDDFTDLSLDLPKKKKKRKNKADVILDGCVETTPADNVDSLEESVLENDAEHSYEDLLSRVFNIMREKDPNRDVESTKKLVMKPPQIIRIGTKKSSFVNFLELCKILHRTPQHVQSFLLVELGTSGSIDGNNQLIIKGRFEQKQIENVLRRYIKEYVSCHTCRSPDTVLQKDTRLFFLQCLSCGARCSVTTIKAGFQAVTGKRAAIRAKAN